MEIWKPIIGYKGYEVSDLGRVRSFRGNGHNGLRSEFKIRIPSLDSTKRYLFLRLRQSPKTKSKTCRISRMVAIAFIPNPDNKPQVNHINGIKTDNRLVNLEWCTSSENQLHSYRTGLSNADHVRGVKNKFSKVSEKQIRVIKHALSFNVRGTAVQLAKMCGMSYSAIKRIKSGETWGHVSN